MFSKILIANRGEIACRVIRTAQRMGIETVAVYSDADAGALHVSMADEAVNIGPAAAAHSYLNIERIIEACQSTQAQGVHPGYGFLSEDTRFCQALTDAGIAFIGPGPDAITKMGDKITSKQIARDAGVNVVPGYDDIIRDSEHAVELARKIGYPVMLKPTAAGGGKGMRLAYSDTECAEGFERSASEALAHFGDDRVFVEKFIKDPRHIEIQVLADMHGNTIHLGERECTLQRRHQKVIEESPSPFLDDATRHKIANQAVALAKAVDYVSAGTVEFVVDRNQDFYFLEMNTRLQVEHPVTEMVTGLDLVELMIRIAAGEKLALKQSDVNISGWSAEARVYAEDPARNFLPSTGRLIRYRPPDTSRNVRVDTGVYEGAEVSMHYDPIIAKLIAYGESRTEAFDHLGRALSSYRISGVTSNLPFLYSLSQHPQVLQANMTTAFIEREYENGYDCEAPPKAPQVMRNAAIVAGILHYSNEKRAATISGRMRHREWPSNMSWTVVINDTRHEISVQPAEKGHKVRCDGKMHQVQHNWLPGQPIFSGSIKDSELIMLVNRRAIAYEINYLGHRIFANVFTARAAELNAHMIVKQSAVASPLIRSPMPGLLVALHVAEGQSLKDGDPVAIVEAMKMQNVIRTPKDGKVAKILAAEGDSLASDQPIVEFE